VTRDNLQDVGFKQARLLRAATELP